MRLGGGQGPNDDMVGDVHTNVAECMHLHALSDSIIHSCLVASKWSGFPATLNRS